MILTNLPYILTIWDSTKLGESVGEGIMRYIPYVKYGKYGKYGKYVCKYGKNGKQPLLGSVGVAESR